MTSLFDTIRARQSQMDLLPNEKPPAHNPEMLLIGCVDARLNPKNDIGIPDGKALMFRDIAALIAGTSGEGDPEHVSEAAALEFAVNVMKVRHIVVMGHTDCGGIRACLAGNHDHETDHIRQYLLPLDAVRSEVIAHGGDIEAQARAMEQAAVRCSVTNLRTYAAVDNAVRAGKLKLHGWVINTATKRIMELDIKSGQFHPMK